MYQMNGNFHVVQMEPIHHPCKVTLCQPFTFSATWLCVLMFGVHSSLKCSGNKNEKMITTCFLLIVVYLLIQYAPRFLPTQECTKFFCTISVPYEMEKAPCWHYGIFVSERLNNNVDDSIK